MYSPTVDDLAEVVLRRHDRPRDDRSGSADDWNTRPASRMGAVRRPGTSFTMPQTQQGHRNAIFVDDDDEDAEDRRATVAGAKDQQATRTTGAPGRSSSTDSSRNADDDDDVLEFSSDDDENAYANMVKYNLYSAFLR